MNHLIEPSQDQDETMYAASQQSHSQEIQHQHEYPHDIPAVLDEVLEFMDFALIDDPAPRRPRGVRDKAQHVLDPFPLKRLGYRPQPAASQLAGFTVPASVYGDAFDYSFTSLMSNATFILTKGQYEQWKLVSDKLKAIGVQFLTFLDAAACFPPSMHSDFLTVMVDSMKTLVGRLHAAKNSLWKKDATDVEDRITNCRIFVFVQRLFFYVARSEGNSIAEFETDVDHILDDLGVPTTYNIYTELVQLEEIVEQKLEEVQEAFRENVQLEWVGEPIPVEDVSTPIDNPDGVRCIVCYTDVTPPGVRTKPCGHSYCRTCLEHWIHAAEKASHTCPYCRIELFPKPAYRVKESQVVRNYQQESAQLQRNFSSILNLNGSIHWFHEEKALQRSYEQDTEEEQSFRECIAPPVATPQG